jgi:hypothetical protein
MKVGDLVRLSEYGIARDYNNALTMIDPHQLGVIIKTLHSSYPYRVHWMKASKGHRIGSFLVNSHSRRELKYAH